MVKYLPIDSEVWERVDKLSGIHRKFHQACHAGESSVLKGPDDRCFVSCVNSAIRVFGERVTPNYCEQETYPELQHVSTCMFRLSLWNDNDIIWYDIYIYIIRYDTKWYDMIWYDMIWYLSYGMIFIIWYDTCIMIFCWWQSLFLGPGFCQNPPIFCAKTWCRKKAIPLRPLPEAAGGGSQLQGKG